MGRAAKRTRDRAHLGGLDPARGQRLRAPSEARLLRSLQELRRDARRSTDVERAVHIAARHAATLFQADEHCCAVVSPGVVEADLLTWTGASEQWDRGLLGRFVRGEGPDVPPGLALARLRRRGRAWGVIALRWSQGDPGWAIKNGLTLIVKGFGEVLEDIDRDRIAQVRARIDRKVLEQLRSRDLFYQVLDGLRSLTRYDHSASLLIADPQEGQLEIVADKLAWRRGKSRRVGRRLPLEAAALDACFARGIAGFRRGADGRFIGWSGAPAEPWIIEFGSTPCSRSPEEPPVGDLLVAPVATRDALRAVLVVAAVHAGTLDAHEGELVASFLPQVAIALQNSRRAEALEAQMLATERKHAMADLARGVAHDVNNALGAIVPLLQQMRCDLREGRVDAAVLDQDLEQIQRSVQVCRDIFGGMLRFARAAARPTSRADVRSAVEMCLMILGDNLRRHRIRASIDVAERLPAVRLSQSELEQIVLNLVTNARDAMRAGGRLSIAAREADGGVLVEVTDDGSGIPQDIRQRIQEPFFTTKSDGSGLGLSICRSLIWQCDGDIDFISPPGGGTLVRVVLPVAGDPPGDADPEPRP